MAAILLSALLVMPVAIPTVVALAAPRDGGTAEAFPTTPAARESIHIPTTLSGKQGVRTLADPESIAAELTEALLRGSFDTLYRNQRSINYSRRITGG